MKYSVVGELRIVSTAVISIDTEIEADSEDAAADGAADEEDIGLMMEYDETESEWIDVKVTPLLPPPPLGTDVVLRKIGAKPLFEL